MQPAASGRIYFRAITDYRKTFFELKTVKLHEKKYLRKNMFSFHLLQKMLRAQMEIGKKKIV